MLTGKLRDAASCLNNGDLAGAERLCRESLVEKPRNPDALHLLGFVHLIGGNARDAATLIGQALEANPHDAAILENLGLAHLVLQDYPKAESSFREALGRGAAHGLLYMRLGLALGSQGRLADALSALRTAADRAPSDPDVQLNLGGALAESGQGEAAAVCFRKVLALQPNRVDAHFNLGTLYMRVSRFDEAIAAYRQALAYAPGYADAHNNLGLIYVQLGRLEDAVASYRRALELEPAQIQAHNNLGNVLTSQGRREEAIACYEKAIAIQPNHPDAYINLGNVRADQGLFTEAQALQEKALLLAPGSFDAHRNLGRLQRIQGRRGEALAHFRRALELDPNQAGSHSDLGDAYRDSGDFKQAEECLRKAVALDPKHVLAHYNLAETLKVQNRLAEAAALDEQVLALKADHFPALGVLIHLRQHMCAWDGIEKSWERLRHEAIGKAGSGISPFSILSQPTSPQEQLACAVAWAEQNLKPMAVERSRLAFDFSVRRGTPGKLRIGYLSWDYHKHATSYLIAELFELHDRDRFETFAYSYGPDDGSAIRARIRGVCDRFIDVANQSYVATAQQVYGDGVDILIDLKGYTQGARPQIMALRAAPIQVSWLGYPGTMGTDCIDYLIADPFIIPEGAERFYSEKVIRLADCYQINDRRREVSDRTPTREECALPAQGIVFCCFNLNYKILPDVFGQWMRIMQAVPGSVLWLLETNRWAVENLRRAAAAQGVAPERLVFAPRLPVAEHLARYRLADLALDTFPYTSHTTASDALWVGCPLVTCAGETFASRVAGSILTNAGTAELVTESPAAYERLALELAVSPARLHELRCRLREGRDSCPLFDTPRFVKNLECAYEEMFSAQARKGGDGV